MAIGFAPLLLNFCSPFASVYGNAIVPIVVPIQKKHAHNSSNYEHDSDVIFYVRSCVRNR